MNMKTLEHRRICSSLFRLLYKSLFCKEPRYVRDFFSFKDSTYNLKPATHLAILFADRREFDRKRFSPPTGCGHTWRFFSPIAAMWHFNLVPRLQAPLLSSILKNHVIKSPNLIG